MVSLFCRQNNLFLSLPAQAINKSSLKRPPKISIILHIVCAVHGGGGGVIMSAVRGWHEYTGGIVSKPGHTMMSVGISWVHWGMFTTKHQGFTMMSVGVS